MDAAGPARLGSARPGSKTPQLSSKPAARLGSARSGCSKHRNCRQNLLLGSLWLGLAARNTVTVVKTCCSGSVWLGLARSGCSKHRNCRQNLLLGSLWLGLAARNTATVVKTYCSGRSGSVCLLETPQLSSKPAARLALARSGCSKHRNCRQNLLLWLGLARSGSVWLLETPQLSSKPAARLALARSGCSKHRNCRQNLLLWLGLARSGSVWLLETPQLSSKPARNTATVIKTCSKHRNCRQNLPRSRSCLDMAARACSRAPACSKSACSAWLLENTAPADVSDFEHARLVWGA